MSEQKIHKCTPYYETVNPGRRVRGRGAEGSAAGGRGESGLVGRQIS